MSAVLERRSEEVKRVGVKLGVDEDILLECCDGKGNEISPLKWTLWNMEFWVIFNRRY